MTAVAYLRRSRVDTRRPGTLSHEQQLARIQAEADRHGDADLLVIEDWGKSGREEKVHLRSGFARLEAMVEAGEVSAIYAYDLSRLGRSVVTMHRLAKRCGALNIPIRCAQGLSPDVSSSDGRLVLTILLAIGEFYADSVKERATAVTMMRAQRGDRIGPAPFGQRVVAGKLEDNPDEDLAKVVDAYRRAGSVVAAARLLNAEGVPTRKGAPWQSSSLTKILETAGVVKRRPRRGRPVSRTFLLSGLLRCACGTTLTGRTWGKDGYVAYECRRAKLDGTHPRPASVTERALVAWVRDEANHYRRPAVLEGGLELAAGDPDSQVAELEARRQRVIDNYEDGLIDRSARNEKLKAIEQQLARMAPAPVFAQMPAAVPWGAPTEALNAVLLALWERVDLDVAMRPVAAAWRVPEWRS